MTDGWEACRAMINVRLDEADKQRVDKMTNDKAHQQALAEEHNRQYQQTTAEDDSAIAKEVIDIIQKELSDYISWCTEHPELPQKSMRDWQEGNVAIRNRTIKALGLQSKYTASGERRNPIK